MRAPDTPTERMRSFLFALLILSADAALDASALDISARTLKAATTTVTIGTSSTGFWSAMPSSPSLYSVAVGDKLQFKYDTYHNVYLMPSQAAYDSCDFSRATQLAAGAMVERVRAARSRGGAHTLADLDGPARGRALGLGRSASRNGGRRRRCGRRCG